MKIHKTFADHKFFDRLAAHFSDDQLQLGRADMGRRPINGPHILSSEQMRAESDAPGFNSLHKTIYIIF